MKREKSKETRLEKRTVRECNIESKGERGGGMRYGKRCNRYSEDEDKGMMGNWRKTDRRERTVERDYNKREQKKKKRGKIDTGAEIAIESVEKEEIKEG